ncbi:hypothetical protein EQ826_21305 [Ectopseudomonas mendocina]|nr:LPD38 domain-containing protein [Pseudomonas mendocina]TRO14104.1 hypothetical protein EQ828_21720 [Pseudomonas mendocina]TRO22259.1 hypothetical protein EQ826_21305 [Pseudomonas mendocina]
MAGLFDDLMGGGSATVGADQPSGSGLFDDLRQKPEQNTSLIGDLGTDLKRGVQQLPGVVTGLADVGVGALTGRRVVDETADKIGEATGFQPSKWQEEAQQEYSPRRQEGSAQIDQAWEEGDALDIAGAYARNPGNVAGLVAESLPQMLAGGAIGRGALAGGRAAGLIASPATAGQAARQAIVAGAGGEGAVIAGGTMDQIDREVDPRRAALASAGAGVAGAALSGFGARLAQRAGLIDVESALAGGVGQVAGQSPGLARRVAGGALTEGVLEELPQSVQEQMLQNWAERKPLMEGVPRAAVEGTLAGSAIGGAVNIARRPSEQMGLDPAAGPLSAAAATAVDGAPTGSQTPVQDAVRQSMLNGAPDTQPGGRYEPISQQLAIAQELFPADLDENGNLRFYRYDQNLQTMVEVPEAEALAAAKRQLDTWESQGFDPQDPRDLGELVPQVDELPAQPPLATVESDTGPQQMDQIEPLPLPTVEADTGPMETEQVQATPVAGDPNFEIRVQKNGRPFRGERDVRLLGLFNQLQREGESPIIVPHEGGWAVAVPREPVPPPAPLGLPAPSTLVVDSQGNAQRGVTAPFVEPSAQVRPIGGPGMERQAPTASRPVTDQSRDNRRDSSVTFARDLQGDDLGSGWVGFNQQSGSLGVPRSEMPQIRADHRGAMVNFMNARGVAHEEQTVPARSLRPTQAEFSPERVGRAAAREGTARSILVSGDGYVLDGHHQWLAEREAGGDVKVIRLNAPMAELLPLAREFPSSFTDQASQEVQGADSRPGPVDDRAAGNPPAVPDAADNVAREPVVAERPAAAGRSAEAGGAGVSATAPAADGQRALSEQPAAGQSSASERRAPVQAADQAPALPEILATPRKRYIDRQARAAGIKKGSPGYDQAIQRLQDQYEADVDRASAGITFEQYNELNSDSPEGVNRQAWEALRQEFGQQYSRNSYRRAPEQGQGARAGQLRIAMKVLTGAWQNAPDIKVVQSIKDLPTRQRQRVERDGAFDVEGIFADGQVYLVADNLRNARHAAFVLQHEVLGHAGLQGAYGQRLTPLLMSIYNGNPEMKAQADALVRRFGYKPAVAMEEVLADMAGAGTIQQQAFWPRLVTAMRNALRSIGFNMRWTEGDIQGLLANARAYIENGRRRAGAREAFSRDGRSGRGPEIADEQGRLLAPNGKPSKLNQKQWHQVRSESFDRWFGDWQALAVEQRLDESKPLRLKTPEAWKGLGIKERQAKVLELLRGFVASGETLQHDVLGEVRLNNNGAKKAVSTSADPAKHTVLAKVQDAIRHAEYSRWDFDSKGREGMAHHKLIMPVSVDGVPLYVVFNVREDNNGRRLHNLVTLDRKEEALAVSPREMTREGQRSTPANTKAPGDFVRRALNRVNPDTVSKVTDGNGEPLVLYHGTAEQFTIFDQSRPGRSTGHTTAPLGVFLTNDGTLAKAYAEKATDGMPGLANVMPLFASIKKPYRMSVAESQSLDSFEKAIAMRQRLEAEGYDGIQLANTGTWVAFYNNQVKSATNNTGAFDQVDPDIRYRRAGQGTVDLLDTFTDRFVTGKTADAFPELNQGARDFLNKIGSPPALTKAKEWVRERTDRVATKIRQGVVDRYAALKELDERLLGKDFIDNAIHSSSWVLARMSSSASGALNAMLSTGRLRFDGKERVITLQDGDKTGGLSAVLTQLGSAAEVERFMGWIAANRADRLMQEGRENLFTADEIASGKQLNGGRTADGKSRQMLYSKVFSEFQQYRDDVLAIAEANGIINADTRAMWRDEFYVPFYRVMDEEAAAGGPRAGKGLSRQEAYKKLKGGKQNLNDLLENTLMNFHHLISASLKNQAATQAMVNAERAGIARVVPESRRDPKTSTFVLKDGERVFYEIDDPLVFESLTALADPGLNNLAVQTMSAFKRLFTNMTTVTPQFILANTMRDLMQASATSPTSKNLFKNLSQGVAGYRDARTRAEMQASGGAFSYGHLYGADVNEVKASLKKTVTGAELVTDVSMVPKLLRAGWRRWGEVADTAENVSRAATYLQNVDDLGRLRAAYEARDIMDFSQHGAWPAIRFLIRVVPFLNARLQGLDKLYRSGVKPALLTAMGQGTASDKQAAARFSAVTGALTLASIALYLANADDDEYRKLEDWQKDAYWFIRIGDNAFFIPKPFEVGAIATMAERVTEQLVDDKATGKLFADRLKDMMMQTFSFNPVPQMFQPVIDIYSNRDAFTGRDIETAGMERLSKGLRSRDSTTVAAQAVSSASRVFGDETPFALSPVQADHLIRGYFGTVGANAAGIIDTVWRGATGQEAPDKRWSEYQPIRRFYRDLGAPAPYTRYSTLFYDGLREANRIYSDVRELQGLGKTAEAQDLAAEKRGILAMRQQLNRQQRRISEINKQMENVRRSDRDGAWKRKEIDRLTLMRSLITDQVGKQIEAVRAQ